MDLVQPISTDKKQKRKFKEVDSDPDSSLNASHYQKVQKGVNPTMDNEDDLVNDLYERIEKLENIVSEQGKIVNERDELIKTLISRIEKLEAREAGSKNDVLFPRLDGTKSNINEETKLKCVWTKDVSNYLKSKDNGDKSTKTKIELVEGIGKREIDRTRTLIAFGVEIGKAKEDDFNKINNIIKEIGVTTDRIDRIYRFKSKDSNKPPPIRVTMKTTEDKDNVMKAASKLKTNFPSVWLKKDLTREELREKKELEELRNKQEEKLKEEHGENLRCLITKKKELVIVINKKNEQTTEQKDKEEIDKDAQIKNKEDQISMETLDTQGEMRENEVMDTAANAKRGKGRISNSDYSKENKQLKNQINELKKQLLEIKKN